MNLKSVYISFQARWNLPGGGRREAGGGRQEVQQLTIKILGGAPHPLLVLLLVLAAPKGVYVVGGRSCISVCAAAHRRWRNALLSIVRPRLAATAR